ncbi:MAG: hypothetical protein OEW52_10550 [Thermoleophilia bacterium]|nr:hypothetical protein [Thermoleophilia bacterium]MDH4339114.1 hypothetical protein [Thermoleophilia bacterium]MDH5281570.1 hypothetical protein [Thermoleophilia bacterium]
MAKTSRERDQEARQAKLEHVREQVASGQLVIREMTDAERVTWDKRHASSEARSTPAELARRAVAVENRRKRAARLSRPADH